MAWPPLLGIPAVRDRVAQEVLRRLLNPLFEAKFHEQSYGFRPGRSCHQAVEKVLELEWQGYRWVLDADISGFFDNLSYRAVMRELAEVVADGNILRLVEKFLKAGVMEGGKFVPTRVGTPQGGVASALLANIALNVLDWHLHQQGYRFVRYAEVIVKLNRVIRGTTNYFLTPWSTCGDRSRSLDRWIRMRLRCMKLKRKSGKDNFRVRLKHFRNRGLLSLRTLQP
jgi:retron-type reverse transcriptase